MGSLRSGPDRAPRRRRRASPVAVLLAVGLLAAPGCAAWRGARLYATGSEALEQGRIDRAIDDLEAAARLAPRRSDVQNHLGIAYTEAGRAADARSAFERAVALDCGNDAAARNLDAARTSPAYADPPAGPRDDRPRP